MTALSIFVQKQKLITIDPNLTVLDAVKLMNDKHIGCVLVAEGDSLRGIFTERDVVTRVTSKELDLKQTRISEVMTSEIDITTITTDSKLEDCYTLMKTLGCRHLPIMDGDKLIGVVSARNVLDWMMEELKKEKELLQQYIQT